MQAILNDRDPMPYPDFLRQMEDPVFDYKNNPKRSLPGYGSDRGQTSHLFAYILTK